MSHSGPQLGYRRRLAKGRAEAVPRGPMMLHRAPQDLASEPEKRDGKGGIALLRREQQQHVRSGTASLSPAFAPLSFVGSAAVAPGTQWFSGFELFGSCSAVSPSPTALRDSEGLSPLSPQPGLNGGMGVGPGSQWGLSLVKSNKSPSVEWVGGTKGGFAPMSLIYNSNGL